MTVAGLVEGCLLVAVDVVVSLAETCPVVPSGGGVVEPLRDCVVETSPDSPVVLSTELVVPPSVAVAASLTAGFVELNTDGPVVLSIDCGVVFAPVAVVVLV